MAIVGIGCDVVEIDRIARAMHEGLGRRFKQRVFTAGERNDCDDRNDPASSYAGVFAAKEALLKALGASKVWGFPWGDIEVRRRESGAPTLRVSGRVEALAVELGATRYHVSISHDGGVAMAQVIVERDDDGASRRSQRDQLDRIDELAKRRDRGGEFGD